MVTISKIINVTCTRCNGSGRLSFNLVRGTVCFGCDGVGTKHTTQAKINAAKKAQEKRDIKNAELAANRTYCCTQPDD